MFASGDVRTARRGDEFFERMLARGTVSIHKVASGRAREVAYNRFLSSTYVTPEGILNEFAARAAGACKGRRVLAVQDTTAVTFAGKAAARRGLGPGGDGVNPGFFIHAVVAVDVEDEAVLGLAGARLWTRGPEKVGDRAVRPIEEKESLRWVEGAEAAASALMSEARQVIVVGDQEADIWSHYARLPKGMDMLVRARHDRALADGGKLFEEATSWPAHTWGEVKVPAQRPAVKARVAQVEIRSSTVRIKRPSKAPASEPAWLELGLVEVIEPNPPEKAKPITWRLMTTLPVDGSEAAQEVVRLYRLRWRVEEVFRVLKTDGLKLDETQVRDPKRLFNLSAMALGVAAHTIQLVDARDGSSRPMGDVLDPRYQDAVDAISKSMEGSTPRQQNPHPKGSLAWLAWVVARHGGWNCYGKPPGPKTMHDGLNYFLTVLSGYLLARGEALV